MCVSKTNTPVSNATTPSLFTAWRAASSFVKGAEWGNHINNSSNSSYLGLTQWFTRVKYQYCSLYIKRKTPVSNATTRSLFTPGRAASPFVRGADGRSRGQPLRGRRQGRVQGGGAFLAAALRVPIAQRRRGCSLSRIRVNG